MIEIAQLAVAVVGVGALYALLIIAVLTWTFGPRWG